MAKKFAKKKTAKAAKPAKRKPVSKPAKKAAKTKKVAKQAKPSASHAKPAERLAPTKAALFAAVVSGIFIKNKDTRVDLLVVGDKMKRSKIEEAVHKLEAEIGTEIVYAVFDTKEFTYRLDMYDKLVRDILDFPHEIVLETKELSKFLASPKYIKP